MALPKIPPVFLAVLGLGLAAALSGGASAGSADADTWRTMRFMTPIPSSDAAKGVIGGILSTTAVGASMQEVVATGHANGFRVYVPKVGLLTSPKVRLQQAKLETAADKAEWTLFLAPDASLPAFTTGQGAPMPSSSIPGSPIGFPPGTTPPIVTPGAPLPPVVSPGSANLPGTTIPANFPSPGSAELPPIASPPSPPSPTDSAWGPRPSWWAPGAPWPPPGLTPPKASDPRPDWLPPFISWPIPGMGTPNGGTSTAPSPPAPGPSPAPGPTPGQFPFPTGFPFPPPAPAPTQPPFGSAPPTMPLPGPLPFPASAAEIVANPPPGSQLFVQPVSDAADRLGGVAQIREMAAVQQDPALSRWLSASADVAYQRQRNKAAITGGTAFTVQSGHNPDNVARAYGGTLAQLRAKNPGKKTDNDGWNVGKVWLLPLEWDAEAKPLPRQLTAAAPAPGASASSSDARKRKPGSTDKVRVLPGKGRALPSTPSTPSTNVIAGAEPYESMSDVRTV